MPDSCGTQPQTPRLWPLLRRYLAFDSAHVWGTGSQMYVTGVQLVKAGWPGQLPAHSNSGGDGVSSSRRRLSDEQQSASGDGSTLFAPDSGSGSVGSGSEDASGSRRPGSFDRTVIEDGPDGDSGGFSGRLQGSEDAAAFHDSSGSSSGGRHRQPQR